MTIKQLLFMNASQARALHRQQTALVAPADHISAVNSGVFQTSFFGPFNKKSGNSVNGQKRMMPLISTLIFLRGQPPHVARFVMSVIINAVQAVISGGASADVGEKLVKRGKEKFNTTPAVVIIRVIVGILASPLRGVINLVLRLFSKAKIARILNRHNLLQDSRLCLGLYELRQQFYEPFYYNTKGVCI